MNPFTFHPAPASLREARSNVNHLHFELMGARDRLRTADKARDAQDAIEASRNVKAFEAMVSASRATVRHFEHSA